MSTTVSVGINVGGCACVTVCVCVYMYTCVYVTVLLLDDLGPAVDPPHFSLTLKVFAHCSVLRAEFRSKFWGKKSVSC